MFHEVEVRLSLPGSPVRTEAGPSEQHLIANFAPSYGPWESNRSLSPSRSLARYALRWRRCNRKQSTTEGGYTPAVGHGHNPGTILRYLEEYGHGEVKAGAGRVEPSAIVAGQGIFGRAEVSAGDENGGTAGVAPLRVVGALDFKASNAAQAVIEKCGAQRRRVNSVPLAVQVSVPTCFPCILQRHNRRFYSSAK
ncbi:hypothetical protein Nepgr_009241 [Nepenthes gracilis]|uniref:Uncharacterized protein n=1 Tax=Nepenthes gracilis TaxID=150966 RepID=A0AAD3SAZ5_NEPGR|nr:hypothetical protein Nepgr_009241 [Nepenthes gracilis]